MAGMTLSPTKFLTLSDYDLKMNTMTSTAIASNIATRDNGVVCARKTWCMFTVAGHSFSHAMGRGITVAAIDSKRFTDRSDVSSPMGITDGV